MTTPPAGGQAWRVTPTSLVAAGAALVAAVVLVVAAAVASGGNPVAVLSVVAAFVSGAAAGPAWQRARASATVSRADRRGARLARRPRGRVRQSSAEQRRDCRRSLASVRSMSRVAEQVADGDSASFIVIDVARALVELLDLGDCRYEPTPGPSGRPVLLHGGELTYRGVRWSPVHIGLPEKGFDLPMTARGRVVGRFVCLPRRRHPIQEDRVITATALVDQAATAQLIEHVA